MLDGEVYSPSVRTHLHRGPLASLALALSCTAACEPAAAPAVAPEPSSQDAPDEAVAPPAEAADEPASDAEPDASTSSVGLRSLSGDAVDPGTLGDGKPYVIVFWATWDAPCKRMLNTLHEEYAERSAKSDSRLIAISVDDRRNLSRVKPYVDSKGWQWQVLLDTDMSFMKSMGKRPKASSRSRSSSMPTGS